MLEKVFHTNDVSNSPSIDIFSHFRDFWPKIDQSLHCRAAADQCLAEVIDPWKDYALEVAVNHLEQFKPHDDYYWSCQ